MKVSVIIPVYNQKEEYLKEAIESVINQTRKPDELIIIDDGSKVPVYPLLTAWGFETEIPMHVIVNEKNMGIGFSRQRGVEEAEGDYIAFLSSDDFWDEKFLEIMIKTAKVNQGKILYSSNFRMDSKGNIFRFNPPSYKDHEDFCIACWESAGRDTMFVNFSSVFIPKEVFKKVQFDKDLKFGEDLDFLLKSMKHFKYYLVNQPLLTYRTEGNLTSKISKKIPEQNKKIRKKCLKYWKIKK